MTDSEPVSNVDWASLPSGLHERFLILFVTGLAVSSYVPSTTWFTLFYCITHPGTPMIIQLGYIAYDKTTLYSIPMFLLCVVAFYAAHPLMVRRQLGLTAPVDPDSPLGEICTEVAARAGIKGARFLVTSDLLQQDGVAFGLPRRREVCLGGGMRVVAAKMRSSRSDERRFGILSATSFILKQMVGLSTQTGNNWCDSMAKRQSPKAEAGSEPDPFALLRPKLMKALVGFSGELPKHWHRRELESRGRPEPAQFPVPDLVLFALRNVLRFSWTGPEEKVRWSVYGMFTGVLVSFELRKFGFTICAAKGAKIDLKRLCGQLQVAVKHVEDWLAPFAKLQATKGNVTVANRYNEFDRRYRFFRDLADRSYRKADKKPRKKQKSKGELAAVFDDIAATWNHMMRSNTQGFYYSTAMVDAFFSRLEHTLVLLRAFCGKPLRDGELIEFLSESWDDKLKALADVDEPAMQTLYSRLKRIKERVRNPFAHGGVENDGGSLLVHILLISTEN